MRESLKPEVVEIAKKITDLPTYGNRLLPCIVDKKKAYWEYLYKLAKSKDITGEMCVDGWNFIYFSQMASSFVELNKSHRPK